jgi:hypothetical protein
MHSKPVGDKKFLENDHEHESVMSEHEHQDNADADFNYLSQCLSENASHWELCQSTETLKIETKRDSGENEVFIRCQAILPRIRKEAAF